MFRDLSLGKRSALSGNWNLSVSPLVAPTMISRLGSHYTVWLLLALPGIGLLLSFSVAPQDAESLLHPSGEYSARFMLVALSATPLRMLFPRFRTTQWLVKNRRYFGVAAFVYALIHALLYLVDMGTLKLVLDEMFALGIWTGWAAFLIFIPLAVASNNFAVRSLGTRWKVLQRTVYAAALFTLVHWIFVHNQIGPALVHFGPLVLLQIYRVAKQRTRRIATRPT